MTDGVQPVSYRDVRPLDYVTAGLVHVGVFVLRLLPIGWASALGGALAGLIGPFTRAHKTALENLASAFPEKSDTERKAIAKQAWTNLGRTSAEFAMTDKIAAAIGTRVEIKGLEHLEAVRAANPDKPILFFGAHMGNWELIAALAVHVNLKVNAFYRAPNNPLLLDVFAGRASAGEMIPKGAPGAKRALKLLRQGESLGLLVDQKQNDGIAVPFFGRDAMTPPALALFALKFEAPILPVQTIRKTGATFEVIVHPPLSITKTGDNAADIQATMTDVNQIIESWIIEHPGQWLWMHRRWPKG